MSTDTELSAYNAGARGGAPIGVAPEDMAAYQAGAQSRGGGGGGAGGGLLLIPFLLALPVAFGVGLCLYPLPGVLTLVGGALISDLMSGVNGLGMLLFLMLPCIAIFFLALALERRLERRPLYRQLRHGARILLVGFVAHAVVFAFRGAGDFGRNVPFLERLSIMHVLLVLAAMVAAHFASRRLDARLGGAAGFFSRFRFRRKEAT
jgi:hypothetical protein